jgi:hypothetical protein
MPSPSPIRWERVAGRPGEGHCRPGPPFLAKCQRTGARAPDKAHITTIWWEYKFYFSPEFTAENAEYAEPEGGEISAKDGF